MDRVKTRTVLSLFSGCGGMDLGFEGGFSTLRRSVNEIVHRDWISEENERWCKLKETSFRTIFANDIREGARNAWVPYFTSLGLSRHIFNLSSVVDLVKRERDGDKVFPRDVDIVTGGFPCQDFSVAGKRLGFNSNKSHNGYSRREEEPTIESRGQLYIWMKEVIEIVRPKVFIAENVKGLVSLPLVKRIIENDFRGINGDRYHVLPAKILNAADYGAPQNRERVIFIGFRQSALVDEVRHVLRNAKGPGVYDPYPKKTHRPPGNTIIESDLKPFVTCGEALMDLPEPEVAEDLSQRSYSKARWYGNHCQGNKEINLDQPSPTIRSEHHGNIEFRRLSVEHGGKNLDELRSGLPERRLTVRECARLQTFPDDYVFVREDDSMGREYRLSASEAYKLIGNAVPPLLAFNIAMRLEELWPQLFGEG